MKKIIAILLISITSSLVIAQESDSILFTKGSWNDILAKANVEHKPIFVDCYTVWCGPCKWMVQNVFDNNAVGTFYNQHFISYACDMEKGDGLLLRKQYVMQGFPTFLFVDEHGVIMHSHCGILNVPDFIALAKVALDTTNNLFSLQQKYNAGNRSADVLYRYANILVTRRDFERSYYETMDTLETEYFKTQSDTELLNEKNWALIQGIIYSVNDPVFDFVYKHRDEYLQRYDSTDVYYFLYCVDGWALQSYMKQNDSCIYNKGKAVYYNIYNKEILKDIGENKDGEIYDLYRGVNLKKED